MGLFPVDKIGIGPPDFFEKQPRHRQFFVARHFELEPAVGPGLPEVNVHRVFLRVVNFSKIKSPPSNLLQERVYWNLTDSSSKTGPKLLMSMLTITLTGGPVMN